MFNNISKDISRAVIIALAAAVIAVAANQVRNPVLQTLADTGRIHPVVANDHKGVNLFDDWSHTGWPGIKRDNGPPATDAENENDEPREVEITLIDGSSAVEIFNAGEAVFVDARPVEEYAEGHIAGAVSWPYDRFNEYLETYRESIPFDKKIVVYCNGGNCDQSNYLADDLRLSGYRDINLYLGGFDEWKLWQEPVETGNP